MSPANRPKKRAGPSPPELDFGFHHAGQVLAHFALVMLVHNDEPFRFGNGRIGSRNEDCRWSVSGAAGISRHPSEVGR